eukprot:TRINITY_DN779_c0_g1_i2.p1 TRINITY_DN779_c0_g1~~TRINITY_DN779_c0_g1_i2.p1  ORF type:complete len:155 (-),score=46.15 TRINITY_DN779_c0_g1_i2:218-682(-)
MKYSFKLSLLILFGLFVASSYSALDVFSSLNNPQKPHYIDGDHNPQYEHNEKEVKEESIVNSHIERIAQITKAVLETCSGCRLKSLPQIRSFIQDDANKYEQFEVKYTRGDPRIHFYNENNIVETIPISELDKNKVNELLLSKGLKLKDTELGL